MPCIQPLPLQVNWNVLCAGRGPIYGTQRRFFQETAFRGDVRFRSGVYRMCPVQARDNKLVADPPWGTPYIPTPYIPLFDGV